MVSMKRGRVIVGAWGCECRYRNGHWSGVALLSMRVEVPKQRQNTVQNASYVALFRDMCASGEGNARERPSDSDSSSLIGQLADR